MPPATATEKTTIIKTGSTSTPTVISRKAPIPPNAPPGVERPIANRNRDSASSARSRIASPRGSGLGSAGDHNTGSIVAAVTVALSTSTGTA